MSSLTQSSYKSLILKALMGVQIVVMPLSCYGTSAGLPDDTIYSSSSGSYGTPVSATDSGGAEGIFSDINQQLIYFALFQVANEHILSPSINLLKDWVWEKCRTKKVNAPVSQLSSGSIEEVLPHENEAITIRPEYRDLLISFDSAFTEEKEAQGKKLWYKRPIIDHFMPYPRHLIGYQYTLSDFVVDIYRMDMKNQPLKTLYTLNPEDAYALVASENLNKPLIVKSAKGQLTTAYSFDKQSVRVPDVSENEKEAVRDIDRKLNPLKFKSARKSRDKDEEESKLEFLPELFDSIAFANYCLDSWNMPEHVSNALSHIFTAYNYLSDEVEIRVSLDTNAATFLFPFSNMDVNSISSTAQLILQITKILPENPNIEQTPVVPFTSSPSLGSMSMPSSLSNLPSLSSRILVEESSDSE